MEAYHALRHNGLTEDEDTVQEAIDVMAMDSTEESGSQASAGNGVLRLRRTVTADVRTAQEEEEEEAAVENDVAEEEEEEEEEYAINIRFLFIHTFHKIIFCFLIICIRHVLSNYFSQLFKDLGKPFSGLVQCMVMSFVGFIFTGSYLYLSNFWGYNPNGNIPMDRLEM